MSHDWAYYAVTIPAVILFGLSKAGFSGFSALGVPIMALVIPPVEAAAISLPLLILQDWVGVWAFRRTMDWRNLGILLPGALVGVVLAWVFAARVSEDLVRLVLGIVCIVFVGVTMLRDRLSAGKAAHADVAPGLFWGACAGFTSFVSHSGGPPFLVYTLPQKLPPRIFAGTSVLFFALVNLMKFPPYLMLGEFTRAHLLASAVLAPVAIASTFAGVWLVRKIPAERFYHVVLAANALLGVKLLYDAL